MDNPLADKHLSIIHHHLAKDFLLKNGHIPQLLA